MASCARIAPALLLHVNVLLAAYGGVALATAARLKWDASTYIAVRELFPIEYRVAAVALCVAGAALLLLAHAGLLALAAREQRRKRAALLAYACMMLAMVVSEAAFVAWVWRRVAAWLRSQQAAQLLEALELRDHVRPLLDYVARWHPLPEHINRLIEEATADAPCNGYVSVTLAVLLALLQLTAAALAALVALVALHEARTSTQLALRRARRSDSWASTDNDEAPLRTAYKQGRLVVL